MDEDGFFIEQCICIVGLGLMGGSLALALRGYCSCIIGVDTDPATLTLAREKKVVDLASDDLATALSQADLMILAAPVRTNLAMLREIPKIHPGPLSIIDLSSTKTAIVAAMDQLPERFAALGGHPMCGKENAGLEYADGKLFWDSTFALTETIRTTPALRTLADKIITIISAQPLWIDAQTHDRWAAATSHLPYILSSALAVSTPTEVAPLIGPGFQSTSRLAASDIIMMMDILTTNREQVLAALSRYKDTLDEIETALKNSDDDVPAWFEKARQSRDKLVKG
ncbi:prephenate dehydrogenase [Chloroflexota bacterium]